MQETQTHEKKAPPESCYFPKTHSYQNRDISMNVQRLMSKVKTMDQLSKDELEKLRVLKQQELDKYKASLNERFDSNKNWSIMIN